MVEQVLGGLAAGAAGSAVGEVIGLMTGPAKYAQQRDHFRAGIGDRADNTKAQIGAQMEMGATITEALGVSSGGGSAGVSGQVMGNGPQMQQSAMLGVQQAFQADQADKDRAVKMHGIDVAADTAKAGQDLTAQSLADKWALGEHANRIRENEYLLRYWVAHQEEGRKDDVWEQGMWRADFVLKLKSMSMGVDNILGSAVYLRGVGMGFDVLDPEHWSDPAKHGRLTQILGEIRGIIGKKATEIIGLIQFAMDYFKIPRKK